MISLFYTEIANLPKPEELAKAIPEPFLRAYQKSHKRPTAAGLGGLWLAVQAGATGEVFYDEKGRPNLSDQNFYDLSISHTKTLVFCALASGEHHRVGLDAEDGGRLDDATMERIAGRFFEAAEIAELDAAGGTIEAFLAIWTKKEAYAKFTGEGLAALLAGKIPKTPCHYTLGHLGETRVAICTDEPLKDGFPEAKKVDFFVKHG